MLLWVINLGTKNLTLNENDNHNDSDDDDNDDNNDNDNDSDDDDNDDDFFWCIKMSYYQFNRQEILQKAKERYSKEKAAEYYLQNKEA